MKTKFSMGLVFFAAAALFAASAAEARSRGRVLRDAGRRTVTVLGENTLRSIASAVGDPEVFRYDPGARRAVCGARLILRGKLVLENETLEMRMPGREGLIGIGARGALILKGSTLKAADNGKYDLVSSGVIRAENSVIVDYDANSSRSFRLEKNSSTILKDCRLRGRYIYIASPAVEFRAVRCDFADSPLSVRLREDVTAELIDCRNVADPVLARNSRLILRRRVTVKLLDGRGRGLSGAEIAVANYSRGGKKIPHAPVVTDHDGAGVITAADLDFDPGGGSNFYRLDLTAKIGGKAYALKKDWRPTGGILEFRLTDDGFVEPQVRGGKERPSPEASAVSAAPALPSGVVPGRGERIVGNDGLRLFVGRQDGIVTKIEGRYWNASGRAGLSLRDESGRDVSGKVSGVRETPRRLTLFRNAPASLVEEEISGKKDHLICRVRVSNLSGRRLFRTVRFAVPVPAGPRLSYWNGLRETGFVPGREYKDSVMTGRFPMSCVYSSDSGIALGIEGDRFFSCLESGGIPGRDFHYAVKMVIDAGKTEEVSFVLYGFRPAFGYLDALQIYYDLFPRFFSPAPGVSPLIYGIGGKVRTSSDPTYGEMCRRFHIGWDWIYAPFQRTGFWYPEKHEWNSRTGRDSSFPPRKEVRYHDLEKYREAISRRQKEARNACVAAHYIIPRSCDTELAERIFPDSVLHTVTGATVSAAGVFAGRRGICMYAAGNSFGERTLGDIGKIVRNYDVGGFAFDEAWGTEFCFGGKGVENSPGRAFVEDTLYALTAVPYALCMDKVHSLKNRTGNRPAVVANMPQVYMCAFRSDAVLFENPWYRGTGVLRRIRRLVGRKPISMWEGYPLVFDGRTDPEELQAQLRKTVRELILFSFATGVTPGIMHTTGFPEAFKAVPAILELTRAGWEPVPAVHSGGRLEIGRFGKGIDTHLALVNRSDEDFSGTLAADNRYFGGGTHFFRSIFDRAGIAALERSKLLACRLVPGRTELKVAVPARSALLLRSAGAVELLSGYCDVTVREDEPDVRRIVFSGDARISGNVMLAFDADRRRFDRIEVNGREVQSGRKARSVALNAPAWKDRLEIVLYSHSRILTENIAGIRDFGFVGEDRPLCGIVVPDAASAEELDAARRLVGYFAFYFRQTRGKRVFLPVRRSSQASQAEKRVLIDSSLRVDGYDCSIRTDPRGISVGGNVGMAMGRLLEILDRRYPWYGECGDRAFQYIRKHGLCGPSVFE
ncbi:MAG: hypothetical protein IJU70_07105 [Lentisphaeria bacterium]|nr:hypothetical protein [Lentisphaeria bacterium]